MAGGQRRERKAFEPPPWEKDAFEALAAKRAEQDEEARVVTDAVATMPEGVRVIETPERASAEDLAAQLAAAMQRQADDAGAVTEDAEGEAQSEAPASAGSEGKLLEVMMLELAQEERSDNRNAKIIAWVASGITAVLGLGMVVAGLVLAAKANGQGSAVMGSAVLTVFGLIFAGMAAWVWISSNRVRGR